MANRANRRVRILRTAKIDGTWKYCKVPFSKAGCGRRASGIRVERLRRWYAPACPGRRAGREHSSVQRKPTSIAMIEFLAVYSNSQRLGIREDERRFHKSADSRVVR